MERSISFKFPPEELVVSVLPLEGEEKENERLMAVEPKERVINPQIPEPTPNAEPTLEGRGKCVQKETKYVKMLRDGLGVAGGNTNGVLPRGMQSGTPSTVVGGESHADHATVVVDESGIKYAMAIVIKNAEGLTPTYEEA